MKLKIASVLTVLLMGVWGMVQANAIIVSEYVTPDDLTLYTGLSWDHDSVKPEGSNVKGAPGFGTSSFYSNVTGSAIGGGVDYTSLRIYADYFTDYFPSGIKVGDINNLRYWTNNTDDTLIDWQVKIYTAPTATDTSWYDHRLNFNRPTGSANVWTLSDINSLGVSDVFDKTANGYLTGTQTKSMYDSESLLFIDIIAGYATNSPSVYSYLDGVTIETSGVKYILDLGTTTVPEPSFMLLFGTGMVGLFGAGLRRNKKVAVSRKTDMVEAA